MASVGEILSFLWKAAPPELAEGFDNVGLIAGEKPGCLSESFDIRTIRNVKKRVRRKDSAPERVDADAPELLMSAVIE